MSEPINYADKYSEQIDERFKISSVTDAAVNKDYEFGGVNKVYVYSVDNAEMNDYTMQGNSRYGVPVELGNRVQEMKLTQDKAFTFTIDRRNNADTMMTTHAARCLRRQIDEVIVPMVDKYRLSKMAEAATPYTPTNSGSHEPSFFDFLRIGADMTENKVPTTNRIVYITPHARMSLLNDDRYTGMADAAAKIAQTGEVEYVDGMKMIVVPSDYLPENALFLITHPSATCSPVKLSEYTIHEDPPGISGWLVEGRTYYDAFVLNNKQKAIAVCYSELPSP